MEHSQKCRSKAGKCRNSHPLRGGIDPNPISAKYG